jgi:cytoskeletal protein CcmA (bactofilin family)
MVPVDNEPGRRVGLLSPTSHLQGDLVSEEELVILGHIIGRRVQAPTITVGPRARVEAEIHTRAIRIEGVVVGDIYASESVIVQASATLQGVIHCPSITIREGALIRGGANIKLSRSGAGSEPVRRSARAAAVRRR